MAAEQLFQLYAGAPPTTAARAPIATGAVVKTLLQLATPATTNLYIVEWGISFDGFSAALPVRVELMSCTGAATVTANASTDPVKLTDPSATPNSLLTYGTSATGYNASAEGTPAAVDQYDVQFIAPTGQYVKQWPLGREPQCAVSRFVRIRVTAAATVNAYCYITWGE